MSRRQRMLEIMAANGLASSDLERERMKGARAAQQAAAWSGLVGTLTDTAGRVGVAGLEAVDDAAMADAEAAVAAGAGDRGGGVITTGMGPKGPRFSEDYDERPEVEAARRVAADPKLNAPAKTGDVLDDLASDFGGIVSRARAKAATKATQGLTASIKGNRATDAAAAKEQLGRTEKTYNERGERERTSAAAATKAKATTDAASAKLKADTDAAAAKRTFDAEQGDLNRKAKIEAAKEAARGRKGAGGGAAAAADAKVEAAAAAAAAKVEADRRRMLMLQRNSIAAEVGRSLAEVNDPKPGWGPEEKEATLVRLQDARALLELYDQEIGKFALGPVAGDLLAVDAQNRETQRRTDAEKKKKEEDAANAPKVRRSWGDVVRDRFGWGTAKPATVAGGSSEAESGAPAAPAPAAGAATAYLALPEARKAEVDQMVDVFMSESGLQFEAAVALAMELDAGADQADYSQWTPSTEGAR